MPRAPARKAKGGGKKKAAPSSLAPRTKKPDPQQRRASYLLPPPRTAGVRVTEDTALTLGAVFACVKVISEDLAGLPWRVHERSSSGGNIDRPEDPSDWLINTQASPETPAFQFRETILAHALTWGNGYAEIERDIAGRPAWLWLITPDRVTPKRDGDEIVYEVQNPVGSPSFLPADDVFHLRGLGFDGLIGYSVIQLAARSIGAGIALDQTTSEFFANDSTPGGVIEHPGRLSEQSHKRLQDDWERRHMGSQNRRRVAILEENMKWRQTGLPPEDTKLIEQRQFTPADICRWFRVKPHKIADLMRATFSNIEQQSIEHVTDTLMPWGRRLETEANIKLFGRTNRGKRFTKLNFNGLLRGDVQSRGIYYNSMLDRGVYCINDVLALEDRNPIGPDGDKRFVQVNMQLLEKAGEEPMPDTEPASTPAEPAKPESPNLSVALRPVFEDACRRMLQRESDRAKSAGRDPAKVEGHAEYIRGLLRPASTALSLSMGVEPCRIDVALATVAELHMEEFKTRMIADEPLIMGGWAGMLTESVADRIMRQLVAAVESMK